jgi:uncharacterized membrane protein YdbT with pleckstrin-like domain
MNRQVRRAEQKKERKVEREKEKVKAERRARREARRAARSAEPEAGAGSSESGKTRSDAGSRRSNPGRFSGALMAATVFFIALQAVAPGDASLAGQAISASFYLLFGYFAMLWMRRRAAPRPLAVTVAAGTVMAAVTLAGQIFQPNLQPLPLMLGLSVPLLIAGALLGRLVWNRAP